MAFLNILRAGPVFARKNGFTRHSTHVIRRPVFIPAPVPEEAKVSEILLPSTENKANGVAQGIMTAGWGQDASVQVASEDDDIRGVLVSHQQPLIARVEGKMAGGLAATVYMLNRF
jgi:hypothetical protein